MILNTKLRLCYKLSSSKHKFRSCYQSCPIILSTKIRGAKIQYANYSGITHSTHAQNWDVVVVVMPKYEEKGRNQLF